MRTVFVMLVVLGVTGCASSRELEGGAAGFGEPPENVELIVRNEVPGAVTVFVWWEGGTRIRLGELRGNRSRTFRTEHRDTGLFLSVELLSSRSVGRGARPRAFIPVDPGDRMEWTLRQRTSQSRVELFWRRLEPMQPDR